jgi:hypothetical protein
MEDVLDVYCQPYDPLVPRICMDEMGKNLVKDKYPPEPAKPGQVAREDYTKRRKKAMRTCSLRMNHSRANALLRSQNTVPRRTGRSLCRRCSKSTIPMSPKLSRVRDNLNTHTPASHLRNPSAGTRQSADRPPGDPLHPEACELARVMPRSN